MRNTEALKASYELKAPLAVRFSARLSEQVAEIVHANGISLAVPIETRVKTWQSLSEKVERGKLSVSDATEVNDLVGLRIILLFKRDLGRVIQLLSSSLTIISTEDTLDRLGVEMFGYQSIHLQAEIPGSWASVPTLKDFVGLQAEIQIRTAAQHIWAAASHRLQYKMESSVPSQVLRSVNRVAALLETVDLEFERALSERDEYASQTEASLKANEQALQDENLNVDLLREVLERLLPAANRDADSDFGKLLSDLGDAKIRRVSELTHLVKGWLPRALEYDRRIASILREEGKTNASGRVEAIVDGVSHSGKIERIEQGAFFTQAGLVRRMLRLAGLLGAKKAQPEHSRKKSRSTQRKQ